MSTLEECRRTALESIGGHLSISRDWIFADFPRHLNVGDSLIWLGSRLIMSEFGLRSVGAFDEFNQDFLRERGYDKAPLMIHGGGNFGDLYPGHHELRLRAFKEFHGRRVVQMPQSINFASSVALDQTRTAIKQHGDVVLLLRDRKSEAFARKHFFADIHLVPDAALALPQDKPIFAPRHSVVVLARSDDEASVADTDRASHHVDWIPEPETIRRSFTLRSIMTAVAIAAGPVRGHRGVVANPTRVYDRFAAWNYARGRRLLSSGQVLVTNRLHAHVFALLLQIPHVVVDDKYSKIHNLDTTWLTGAGAVRWAPDLRRAEQVAEDWALELGSPCDNEQ